MDEITQMIEDLINGAYNAGYNARTDSDASVMQAHEWMKAQKKRLIKAVERHLSEASTRPDKAGVCPGCGSAGSIHDKFCTWAG